MHVQRFYLDGRLVKVSVPHDLARLRKWLDNVERKWSRDMRPLAAPGDFDPNKGHSVNRV
jgi:hypothetical protein